jgi:cysteine-rich secretory family protein
VAKAKGFKKFVLLVSSALIVFGLLAENASADQFSDEDRFIQLINSDRAASGLPGLAMDGTLRDLARRHSGEMAGAGQIFHNSGLASQVPGGWSAIGENVGVGGSVDGLHAAFMNSSGHRANVLGGYDKAGIGIVMSGSTIYVTEVFWKSASSPAAAAPAPQAPAPVAKSVAAPAAAPAAARSKMKCRKVGRRVKCKAVAKKRRTRTRSRARAPVRRRR